MSDSLKGRAINYESKDTADTCLRRRYSGGNQVIGKRVWLDVRYDLSTTEVLGYCLY